MAITYKAIERGEPGIAGGGAKKYYSSGEATGTSGIEQLNEEIERIRSEPSDTSEEINSYKIMDSNILSRLGGRFKTMLQTLEYKKG